jgi:hypothetical protein
MVITSTMVVCMAQVEQTGIRTIWPTTLMGTFYSYRLISKVLMVFQHPSEKFSQKFKHFQKLEFLAFAGRRNLRYFKVYCYLRAHGTHGTIKIVEEQLCFCYTGSIVYIMLSTSFKFGQ